MRIVTPKFIEEIAQSDFIHLSVRMRVWSTDGETYDIDCSIIFKSSFETGTTEVSMERLYFESDLFEFLVRPKAMIQEAKNTVIQDGVYKWLLIRQVLIYEPDGCTQVDWWHRLAA